MTLKEFVQDRMSENSLPAAVQQSFTRLLMIIEQIPDDAEGDEVWSWITGAEVAIANAVLGYDNISAAERLTTQLLAALALSWADHPDFDPDWPSLVPDGSDQ